MHTNGGMQPDQPAPTSNTGKARVVEPWAAGVMKMGNTEMSDPGSLFNQGRDWGANRLQEQDLVRREKKQELTQRSANRCGANRNV